MNSQLIFEKVKELLDIPEENENMLTTICTAVSDTFSPRLKEGFNGSESEVIYLMAAYSVYRYALLRGCQEDSFDSLKAGDITVSRSASSLLEFAEKLLCDAVQNTDCLNDTNFIFRGM